MNGTVDDRPGPSRIGIGCALLALLVIALAVRANFVVDWFWQHPAEAHHTDEKFLPYEALALWEGVTPRELGWPASTLRVLLCGCYAIDLAATHPELHTRGGLRPAAIMDAVVGYTEEAVDDPSRLYAIGRWVSVIIGTLQVLFAYWAVRRWLSPPTGLLAALMCALAPIAVEYSQFVLADLLGVLFVTWLMGLLAVKPEDTPLRPTFIGALLGLAVASKYHFSLWLVPALLAVWMAPHTRSLGGRFRDTIKLGLAATAVYLMLVPWAWTNPVVVAKEFLATVFAKMEPINARPVHPLANLVLIFRVMGLLVVVGLVPGLLVTWHRLGRRSLPILAVLGLGVLLIARAGDVYDRYGLLFFPAAVLVAAAGYAGLLASPQPILRFAGVAALGAALAVTGWQLAEAQRHIGGVESHAQAVAWLRENLRPGDRIAVDSLNPQPLPRTPEQLTALIAESIGPDAYARKMQSNGYSANPAEPMRQAVLGDELFRAHWLQRERAMRQPGEGYHVTLHSNDVLFNCISTAEAIAQFKQGLRERDKGFDALLLIKPADLGVEPVKVFRGGAAPPLYVYVRPKAE